MTYSLNDVIARLVDLSHHLDTAGREELDRMQALMEERGRVTAELHALLERHPRPLSDEQTAALEQVQQAAMRLREKLLLSRAGLRNQLSELYQSGFLLRAFSEPPSAEAEWTFRA
jgi:dTDP-4-amino-4,6-dideoxygalactose transaminase